MIRAANRWIPPTVAQFRTALTGVSNLVAVGIATWWLLSAMDDRLGAATTCIFAVCAIIAAGGALEQIAEAKAKAEKDPS